MGNWSDRMDGRAAAQRRRWTKRLPAGSGSWASTPPAALALLGMFAVHVTETLRSDNTPSHTQQFVAGHALATFVLLAGVSLAFTTGRQAGCAGRALARPGNRRLPGDARAADRSCSAWSSTSRTRRRT